MFQKVANMAPTWAQVGAMLGSKIVLDTSKSDTEKNIQKHKPVNAWNGKRAFIVDPEGDLRTCVCTCLYEFVYTAMLKIKQKYTQTSIKIQPKIIPKSVKNRPKNRPKVSEWVSKPAPDSAYGTRAIKKLENISNI